MQGPHFNLAVIMFKRNRQPGCILVRMTQPATANKPDFFGFRYLPCCADLDIAQNLLEIRFSFCGRLEVKQRDYILGVMFLQIHDRA